MVTLKVLRRISESRCRLLLLGLLVITAQLMGQSLVGTGSQPFAVAVNPATNTIYVVNNGPNTVTVIDGATNATRTVIVGTSPVAISVNPVTNEAYVANSGDGTVTVINEAQGSVRNISVGENPEAIVVNPLTNKIYVAAANGNATSTTIFNRDGNVVVIDGRTDTVTTTIEVGRDPFALALNPVTNRIYVANAGNDIFGTVSVIDGSNDTLSGSPIVLGDSPHALAVNPVTNKIYVINSRFELDVIDGANNTFTTTPFTTTGLLPNRLTAIAVNPVTNFIYVTESLAVGTLIAVNGATNTISGVVFIGNDPEALAVNSVTNRIYVTDNATRGNVIVIDGSTNTKVNSISTGNSPGAVAVNPVTNRVYVANFRDDNVAVVDGATSTTNTIDAGSSPNAVAVNQVTNRVYVPNMGDNTVTVIDAANGGTTSTLSTGIGPTAVAVNPATNKIYVPNSGSADVTVIDGLNGNATTQVSAGQGSFAVAVNIVNNKTFVTNSTDNSVTVIDGATNGTSNITVGTAPKGLAINESTSTIVVANQGSDDVTVLNGITNGSVGTVAVGNSPVAVGVNPAENNYYVVNQASNNVTVVDGDTLQPIDLIPVGRSPGAVVVDSLTNRIYVANQSDNSVSVIDGTAGNVIATVPTGRLPYALDLNPLTNRIDVANQSDGTVTVVDGTGDTVSATLPTGSLPSGVAVNPVTNQVYVANRGSGNVTVITVGAQQPVPLNIVLTPVTSGSDSFTSGGVFETFNETPSFNVTVTSAYTSSPPYAGIGATTNPPPTQVYYSADGATPWSLATPTSASGSNPASYTITLSPLDSGLHTLYVFASYGNLGGHSTSGNGTGNSPEMSNLQRLPLLVLPNATTTALVSDAPNGAQEGARIVFTATVTESGSPVTEGLVQFSADGKTQGLPVQVNSNGVATDTNNALTPGSHTIQAFYLGTDKFLESSATLIQKIYGLAASIAVDSGSNQSAAVNRSYASPLVAIVKDAVGDPVPNITVTWATNGTTTAPGGTLSAATSTTDANGLASVNVTANGKAGSFPVMASAVGPPAQFTLTNTAGAATSITIHAGSSPQTTVINTQFTQPLTVFLTDAGGNPVQGVTVTYVANGTTANASLNALSTVTDSLGFASAVATANGTTGAYTVTAAAGSVGSVNFALRNNAAATSTSLAPPTQTVIYGNTINFTANVNQPSATGAVNFFLGTELLGSATLHLGSATLALNQIPITGQFLPAGTYSNMTATYPGDNNFAGSSSGPVQVIVTKRTAAGGGPGLTVIANSVTRQFGQPNPPFSYIVQGTLVPGDTTASAVTGTAVFTTSAVPGSLVGTYPLSVSGLVSANYEIAFQDGTVTVTQGNSTTTIATASTNIMYGDQEVLTAAVTQGATGTVSFYEGSTLLGTASLDSATQAELPFDNLPVGVHTITATFNGGPNLLPSTSSPATVTVTQRTGDRGAAALTIVVRDATRPANGELAILTYYVTGQLFNNDTYETAITGSPSLASPADSDPGTYPITISGLTSNNYTLTSVPGTLFVTDDAIGKPSTTTLTVNPSSGQYGDPITLTATTSPTVASGRVTFYDVLPSGATVFIGDATLSRGTATFVASTLNAGTHSVEAAYSGDGIYSTSISQPSTVTVAKKEGPGGGAALTITVQNASRQVGTANPYFAFIVTGTLLPGDTFESAVTGVASYATTDTPSSSVGTTYPITVTGLVSQNYEIATVPGTLTIAPASSTTNLAAAQTTGFTAAQYGDTVTLTANVVPTTATGTVVFLEGQTVLGTAQADSATGVASLTLTTLQAGRHTITAMYLGDNNVGASTSTPVTIVVSQKTGPSGEPYLIVTPNNTSRIYGQAKPAFTYTVSGALLNGDTPATAVKGVPIYSTPASFGSPAGTYPLSITGGLSSLNYLIEFQDGTFTVTPTSLTVALASSPNPVTYGKAVLFTATLPLDATGTLTFYDGTAVFGTGSLSGGVATQLTNSLTAGTHSITAQYEGDVNYNAAVSTALSQVVNKATPAITLASSPNPSTFGANVTFTATLPANATGTVTFLDGTTTLGAGIIGTGIASLSTSSLTAGTHSITAQYGGDTNYNSAISTAVSQVVSQPTPASITASAGDGQTTVIGTSFPGPLVATVKDSSGDGVPGVNVTFTANPGSTGQSGTFSNSTGTITVATNNSGQASSGTFTANSHAGSYTVTARAGTLSATFDLTNAPGAPATILLTSGSGQGAVIDTAFANPLIATVLDAGENPVPGATVTFDAPAGLTSSLVFSNASITISEATNLLGEASSGPMTANGILGGPYDVQASVGSIAVNFQLTNLGKSLTTFASLTTTAATIDVFGFGFSVPSGSLAFTNVTTGTPVTPPVTLDTSMAVTSLQPQVTTSTGADTLPVWTTLADINGDGKFDLITSLYMRDSVSVQLGNGDGTFQAATNILIATGFGPAEVHAVSLKTGTVDLIVGSFNLNQIAVLPGNGNGTFGTPAFYTVGSAANTPTSLTTGDFNDDGQLDVAVANTGDDTISILLGDGSGSLTLQRPAISVGRDPEAIRAGDFNGDGYSDLAVANYSDGTVTTLLNDKDGTFTATTKPVGSGASSGPQALAIDGNGSSLLLAVANYRDNTVSVMQSDGSGSFAAQTIIPVGNGPDDVNFADFDGNGTEDLVVSNYTSGTVNLVLAPTGSHKVLGPFKVGNNPYSAAVGDLNLDGTPDLVVANCFSNNTGMLLDGTLISIPYSGLSLPPGDSFNASYTPDGVSKYGSSNSGNIAPQSLRRLRGIQRKSLPTSQE